MDAQRCEECGFTYQLDEATLAAERIVDGSAELADLILDDGPRAWIRRDPAVWSPLEYACHVRDMLLVQRERVLAARRRETPACEPMGRDERVEHDGYAQQDPADVARQLVDAAGMLARVLSRLDQTDWERSMIYTYPERCQRSLRWVAVHTVHEVRHHALDVSRQRGASITGEARPTRS